MIQNPAIQGGCGEKIPIATVTIKTGNTGRYQTIQDGKITEKEYDNSTTEIKVLVSGYIIAYGRRGIPTCSGNIERVGYDTDTGVYVVSGEGTIG